MNTFWKEAPFLRLLIPFLSGISLYIFIPDNHWWLSALVFLCLLLGLSIFSFLKDFLKMKYAFLKGILMQGILVAAGYLLCVLHTGSSSANWYGHRVNQFEYALVKIQEEPQQKPKTLKAAAEVVQLQGDGKSMPVQGRVLIYFQKSEKAGQLKQGDVVLVKNKFMDIRPNGNPGEFDYAAYCASKNIFQSSFLKDNEWQQSTMHVSGPSAFFNRLGNATRACLKKNIHDSVSLGIAEALLIGYRNDIDPEVWQAYSNTGIVHIIAISGMHMAMIYMSVRWLLFLIPFMKRKRILSLSIAILFMWLFAGVTGLPPSVTRAAIMFSLLGIGEMLDRDISGINNLAASAFCLLCINPFWITDVGFQLSYLAVVSLLLFYSHVYSWFFISNRYLDAVWKLMAGTIAAQILTFPLCVYYFHQFPLLFLFTNLLAVPATTIILYAEIVLIAFSWIKPFAMLLGQFISTAIHWLNEAVFFTGHLSFAVWSGLQISMFQMILLFAIVLLSAYWLMKKKAIFLPAVLGAVLLLVCSFTFERMHRLQQKKFVVYAAQKQQAIEFIQGEKYFSPDEKTLSGNTNTRRYVLQPARLFMGVKKEDSSIIKEQSSVSLDLFQFEGKIIARLKRNDFMCNQPLEADYLILSGECRADADWVKSNFIAKQIILDSSVPFWETSDFKRQWAPSGIPIHVVGEDGAFEVGL